MFRAGVTSGVISIGISGSVFVLMLTLGVYYILHYYIIYYTYIILYYYILLYIFYLILYSSVLLLSPLLSYTLLLFCSSPSPPLLSYTLLFLPFLLIPILFYPFQSSIFSSPIPIFQYSFKVYVSGLTSTYLYSINISFQNNLTPHVLSEWMVEGGGLMSMLGCVRF